jgi:hypothetical protein
MRLYLSPLKPRGYVLCQGASLRNAWVVEDANYLHVNSLPRKNQVSGHHTRAFNHAINPASSTLDCSLVCISRTVAVPAANSSSPRMTV